MKHRISIVQTLGRLRRIALVAAAMSIPFASSATIVKALSFAVYEAHGTGDKTPIKTFMATNDVDFGAFEYARADNYFINADFTLDDKHFKVAHYMNAGYDYKYFIYNSDKYELVDEPDGSPIFRRVAGPAIPSGVRPCFLWKFFTPASVFAP